MIEEIPDPPEDTRLQTQHWEVTVAHLGGVGGGCCSAVNYGDGFYGNVPVAFEFVYLELQQLRLQQQAWCCGWYVLKVIAQ